MGDLSADLDPALPPDSVAAIVKRQARLAELEGDFGAHSLRSDFVTEAGKQGSHCQR